MVKLVTMSNDDYTTWRANAVKGYAQDKTDSGNWAPEEALGLSEGVYSELLPEGTATENNYLFSILDDDTSEKVGVIWVAVTGWTSRKSAFIYDFIIFEPFRRRGYGTQAMLAIEGKVRDLGLDKIGLHVFGHNHNAIDLYKKVGYSAVNINMEKKLGDGPHA